MRNQYGYGSYHGRSRFRSFLKIVIIVLVIVLLLLVGAFFFLQQYVVYSADGVRLELPFLGLGASPTPAPTLVVEPSGNPVVVATPSPTPEPEPEYFCAVSLPDSALHDDYIKDLYGGQLPELEAYIGSFAAYPDGRLPSPVLTMKGIDGQLGYVSDLQLAKEVKSSSGDPERNGAISSLNSGSGGRLHTVAYVACFRDNTAPYQNNRLALRTSIGNWRGPGDIRWMSPQVEAARQYVAEVCGELAALGFQEVLLDYAAFPTQGEVSRILTGERYSPDAFEDTISGFYSQVRESLSSAAQQGGAPNVAKLSIVTDKLTLDQGTNPSSGQSLSTLAEYADRIYVDLEGADPAGYYDKLRQAGMEHPEENLVVILDQAPEKALDYSWAVLPQ